MTLPRLRSLTSRSQPCPSSSLLSWATQRTRRSTRFRSTQSDVPCSLLPCTQAWWYTRTTFRIPERRWCLHRDDDCHRKWYFLVPVGHFLIKQELDTSLTSSRSVMWPWRAQTVNGATGSAFAVGFVNSYGQVGDALGPQMFQEKYSPGNQVPIRAVHGTYCSLRNHLRSAVVDNSPD